MARQQEIGRQEGSRWINRRPEPDEFARWFRENVFLHEGMDHAPFLPGITLIPNKEKVREPRVNDAGALAIIDVEQLVYTPYPMVDTRVDYWWKWRMQHPEWTASLKAIPRANPNDHLPEGFWQFPVADSTGKVTPFIAVTYQAVMRQRRGGEVITEGVGTKVVPLLKRLWNGSIVPDENAIARAETGAKGRTLGAAGILIIPGAGIATAEDMLEFLATGAEAPAAGVALPPAVAEPASENGDGASNLPELVAALTKDLSENYPEAYEEMRAWAHEKGYKLEEPPEQALRGLERQLRRKLEQAKARAPETA